MLGHIFNLTTIVVDRLWVGEVGTEALAALGTAHVALMLLLTLIMGMATGTLSRVARSVGAGDLEEASLAYGQGLLISMSLGVAFLGISFFAPAHIMAFMGADPAVAGPATEYLSISMAGLLLNAPLFVTTFAIQGAGEGKAALKLAMVAPIINAILDPLLIFNAGLGLPGAAWATVIANTLGLAFGLRLVVVGGLRVRLRRSDLRPTPRVAHVIMRVGVPGTLEHMVRTAAAFSLVKILTPFGAHVISAYTTSTVLLMALIFPGLALGQATASLVGQSLGAGDPRQAWRTAWAGTGVYVVLMVVAGALCWVSAEPLIAMFDSNPAVVAEGVTLLRINVLSFPLIAVALVLSKSFGGAGHTLPAMGAAATGHLLFQIPVAYFATERFGPVGAYWAMSIAFMIHGLAAAALFYYYFRPKTGAFICEAQ